MLLVTIAARRSVGWLHCISSATKASSIVDDDVASVHQNNEAYLPSWASRADRTVAWGLQQCAASRSLEPETTSLFLNPTRSSDWTAQRTAFQQATSVCGQQRIWSWRPEKTWKGPKIGSREARERPEKAALQLAFPSMSPWSLTRARSTSLICGIWTPVGPCQAHQTAARQPHQRQHGRLSFSWS